MELETVYVHTNTSYIHTRIKQVLRDEQAGSVSREQAAIELREWANKLEAKEVRNVMTLFELQEHIQEHLHG